MDADLYLLECTQLVTTVHDEYRAALEQVIAAKTGTGTRPVPAEEAPPPSAEGVDLIAMLEKSVQDAKATRGEPGTVHQLPGKKTVAKKAATKKGTSKGKPRHSADHPGRDSVAAGRRAPQRRLWAPALAADPRTADAAKSWASRPRGFALPVGGLASL
ncbi:hypothetical protein [Streptomyces sp. NRRL S-237]|uniref:hypothetical protein n=1 Tax=Streptomyces sp. NRRL S-237 TaxID=1463895 RepID=UPI0004C5A4C0|nr:hypothetical protein [Streptomyces sp. NRRL S-237]